MVTVTVCTAWLLLVLPSVDQEMLCASLGLGPKVAYLVLSICYLPAAASHRFQLKPCNNSPLRKGFAEWAEATFAADASWMKLPTCVMSRACLGCRNSPPNAAHFWKWQPHEEALTKTYEARYIQNVQHPRNCVKPGRWAFNCKGRSVRAHTMIGIEAVQG